VNIEILHRPASAAACVTLQPGETWISEGGAMIAMDASIAVETTTRARGGGVLRALRRSLAGESFFLNHFTAGAGGGRLWLAPKLSGDIEQRVLDGGSLVVQGGSFLACAPGIEIDLGWQGMRSLLAGEGLFWIHARGRGPLLLSSFGAIYAIDVDGRHFVDSGHVVAFEETLGFRLSKVGGSWMTSILSGEGLVCEFSGRGRIWCQSHSARAFGRLLGPLLKAR
jgi:uncharacterized protein (TIGR00266 family)